MDQPLDSADIHEGAVVFQGGDFPLFFVAFLKGLPNLFFQALLFLDKKLSAADHDIPAHLFELGDQEGVRPADVGLRILAVASLHLRERTVGSHPHHGDFESALVGAFDFSINGHVSFEGLFQRVQSGVLGAVTGVGEHCRTTGAGEEGVSERRGVNGDALAGEKGLLVLFGEFNLGDDAFETLAQVQVEGIFGFGDQLGFDSFAKVNSAPLLKGGLCGLEPVLGRILVVFHRYSTSYKSGKT